MSSTAPPPSTATITLPPGFTLDQFTFLQGQAVAIAIVVSSLFAITIWDYFVLLPDEIALYRAMAKEDRLWRTPTTYLFILLRYSGILAFLPALFFTAAQSGHCQAAAAASQAGVVLAVTASGAIFCFRIFSLWRDNRLVQGVVTFAYLLMVACWISVGSQYHAVTGPPTPFASNCTQDPIPDWNIISFISSVIFDTLVLGLTLLKLRPSFEMQKNKTARSIFRDTLMYFMITTFTNVVVLVIESLKNQPTLIKPATIPFSTIMTIAMGSRVYLNLKLLEHRRRKELEGIPLSAASGLSSEAATRGTMTGRFGAYTQDDGAAHDSYAQNPTVSYISSGHGHQVEPTSMELERKNLYPLTPETNAASFTLSPSSRAETLPYSKQY